MGVPLSWSLMEEAAREDPRFVELKEDKRMWEMLENLKPDEPLPEGFPDFFYQRIYSYLKAGCYADRIEPFLRHFKREK